MNQNPPTIMTDEGLKVADGSLVSRQKNPLLYARIGHAYTDEDERCTTCDLFRLPDYTKLPEEFKRKREEFEERCKFKG